MKRIEIKFENILGGRRVGRYDSSFSFSISTWNVLNQKSASFQATTNVDTRSLGFPFID